MEKKEFNTAILVTSCRKALALWDKMDLIGRKSRVKRGKKLNNVSVPGKMNVLLEFFTDILYSLYLDWKHISCYINGTWLQGSFRKIKTQVKEYLFGRVHRVVVGTQISCCHVPVLAMLKFILFGPCMEEFDSDAIVYKTKSRIFCSWIAHGYLIPCLLLKIDMHLNVVADLNHNKFYDVVDENRFIGCGKSYIDFEDDCLCLHSQRLFARRCKNF